MQLINNMGTQYSKIFAEEESQDKEWPEKLEEDQSPLEGRNQVKLKKWLLDSPLECQCHCHINKRPDGSHEDDEKENLPPLLPTLKQNYYLLWRIFLKIKKLAYYVLRGTYHVLKGLNHILKDIVYSVRRLIYYSVAFFGKVVSEKILAILAVIGVGYYIHINHPEYIEAASLKVGEFYSRAADFANNNNTLSEKVADLSSKVEELSSKVAGVATDFASENNLSEKVPHISSKVGEVSSKVGEASSKVVGGVYSKAADFANESNLSEKVVNISSKVGEVSSKVGQVSSKVVKDVYSKTTDFTNNSNLSEKVWDVSSKVGGFVSQGTNDIWSKFRPTSK